MAVSQEFPLACSAVRHNRKDHRVHKYHGCNQRETVCNVSEVYQITFDGLHHFLNVGYFLKFDPKPRQEIFKIGVKKTVSTLSPLM